jgi:LuxR family maltose regulon positive regulatory protein
LRASLLRTKLSLPPLRDHAVARPRLLARLDRNQRSGGLILICAPAGFGKTTLVGQWLARASASIPAGRVAWLALDAADADPARFFAYFLAALQTVEPGIGQAALSLADAAAGCAWADGPMAALINELEELAAPLLCVLDDYQHITDPQIHAAVQLLLDQQPAGFQLILLTREDPPLALARLRARGQVVELRADDLRFTPAEAITFFSDTMGLALAPAAMAALAARTEGWIAGLQLAALSLQGLDEAAASDLIAAFSGSHRYVIDYLVEEVLARQPASVRAFLRGTACLERLCGPLCDAVLGIGESANLQISESAQAEVRPSPLVHSHAILEYLDRANLFVLPLDGERRWYRYHRLFADALRADLDRAAEDTQHGRAAAWYAANGYTRDAITHALAAADWALAAHLIIAAADELLRAGEVMTLSAWLAALPEAALHTHPELLAHGALAALLTGDGTAAARWAGRLAERAAEQAEAASGARSLTVRAWLASTQGRPEVMALAQQAVAAIPADDPFYATLALITLGFAQNVAGDVPGSDASFRAAYQTSDAAGQPFSAMGALANLCFNLLDQGRFNEAETLGRDARARQVDRRGRPLPVVGIVYVPLAVLAYARDDLAQAETLAREGLAMCRRLISGAILGGDAEITLAQIHFARGETGQAYALLAEARRAAERERVTVVAERLALAEALLRLRDGDLSTVARALTRPAAPAVAGSQADSERRQVLLARLNLAQGRVAAARAGLAEAARRIAAVGRTGRLAQIQVLQAVTEGQAGEAAAATAHLRAALALAAAEGYRRAFLDAGPAVAELLAPVREVAPGFVDDLLARFGRAKPGETTGAVPPPDLIEPLSDRELELLRLLAAGQSNQEIADRLVITVGTAKWHLSNIYGKLGVRSRTQALARARKLALI